MVVWYYLSLPVNDAERSSGFDFGPEFRDCKRGTVCFCLSQQTKEGSGGGTGSFKGGQPSGFRALKSCANRQSFLQKVFALQRQAYKTEARDFRPGNSGWASGVGHRLSVCERRDML